MLAHVAALAAVLIAADAPLAPSTIVANPSTYDGKTVTVTGNVANFQTARTARGTVSFFQLCDGQCVVVIDATKPAYKNGDHQTASGTFHTTFKGPRRTFSNVVLVQ